MFKTKLLLAALTLCALTFFTNCSKSGDASPSVPIPVADFSFSGNGLAPSTVTFTNTSAPISSGLSYVWDFGDGSATSTVESPSHTYTQGGTYTVKLTAKNSAGSNSYTKSVTILTPVLAKITSVKIVAMPFTNTSGGTWDLTSGPDIYFTLNGATGSILHQSSPVINDMLATQIPFTWTLTTPFAIANAAFPTQYSINIWDDDSPLTADAIGGYYFKMSDYVAAGYPTTILLQSSSSASLKIQLTVQWQ